MSDTRRLPALDSILQDLRYTFRTLGKDSGFTTFAVLIVGLGIGAIATVFSVVDTLLLRPLPFHQPERVTVAGVLPATFDMAAVFAPGSHFDLYFPFPLSNETNRWGNTMAIIGRLKPSVSIGSAQAELKALAQQITQAHPERNDFEG